MNLGEIKRGLEERFARRRKHVSNTSLTDLTTDKVEKAVIGFLEAYGLDFRIDRLVTPPDVEVLARQGTFWVPPAVDVYTSTLTCLTWRARDKGELVIDHLDFIAEDPIGEDWCKIRYWFTKFENTPNFQEHKEDVEPGHWKFNRVVLVDGEVMKVCIENLNPYAAALWSYESRCWML